MSDYIEVERFKVDGVIIIRAIHKKDLSHKGYVESKYFSIKEWIALYDRV